MAGHRKLKTETYHATMMVMRAEEWCVDASSMDEAKALLAAGQGHRCHRGDAHHVELHELHEEKS